HRGIRRYRVQTDGPAWGRLADLLIYAGQLSEGLGPAPSPGPGGGARSRGASEREPVADLRRPNVRGGRSRDPGVHRPVLRRGPVERVDTGQRQPRDPRPVRRTAGPPHSGRRRAHRVRAGGLPHEPARSDRPGGHPPPSGHDDGGDGVSESTFIDARRRLEAKDRSLRDKRTSLVEAAALVKDGDHVAIGGGLYSRTRSERRRVGEGWDG